MPNTPPALIAKGDINPSRFVALDGSTNHGVIEANADSRIIGISQEGSRDAPIPNASTLAAADGDHLRIYGDGDECLLEIKAQTAVVSGDLLKSDADGRGEPIDATATTVELYGAIALETIDASAAATFEKIRVQVRPGEYIPALS